MTLISRIKSGSRMISGQPPIERVVIGLPGTPLQLITHRGRIYIYNPQGQTLIDGGMISTYALLADSIITEKLAISTKQFVHNLVWVATDYNTCSWSAGVIKWADGSTFNINAGNTGNITEKTYIYYNGTATLQKTTFYDVAVGTNAILLAIIEPVADTNAKCLITPMFSVGRTVDGNKITTGKIQSGDGKTYFDLVNEKRLVLDDGSTKRALIGKVAEGKYGIRVSLSGYDAVTDSNPDHFALYADEDWVLIKEKTRGSVTVEAGATENIAHGLSYVPFVLVFGHAVEGTVGTDEQWTYMGGRAYLIAHIEVNVTNLVIINASDSTSKTFKYYIFYDQQV